MVFGLGAQVSYQETLNNNILSKTLIEHLHLLSHKCRKMFLRCQNTQKILHMLNINNTEVCGCPSILLKTNHKLSAIIEKQINLFKTNINQVKLN